MVGPGRRPQRPGASPMTGANLPPLADAIAAHFALSDAFDAALDDQSAPELDDAEALWQRAAKEPRSTTADAMAKLRLMSRYQEAFYREDGTDLLILRDAINRLAAPGAL